MSKIAVVYWSGTGNTEIMADKVAQGAREAGADVTICTSENFTADQMDGYEASLLDALPWETRSWKKQNLRPCSKAALRV